MDQGHKDKHEWNLEGHNMGIFLEKADCVFIYSKALTFQADTGFLSTPRQGTVGAAKWGGRKDGRANITKLMCSFLVVSTARLCHKSKNYRLTNAVTKREISIRPWMHFTVLWTSTTYSTRGVELVWGLGFDPQDPWGKVHPKHIHLH